MVVYGHTVDLYSAVCLASQWFAPPHGREAGARPAATAASRAAGALDGLQGYAFVPDLRDYVLPGRTFNCNVHRTHSRQRPQAQNLGRSKIFASPAAVTP